MTVLAIAAISMVSLACACRAAEATDPLEELARRLTGSFSSAAQAAADTSYFDIRLHVLPIWPDDRSCRWLYVEQATAAALERPYRQRVYRLTAREDGSLVSEVFELADPARFAGAWRSEAPLSEVSPDSLLPRAGCDVVVRLVDDVFSGGTEGSGCASSLRGASYATSEVRLFPDHLETWDRGFDAEDKQVWGATQGPYIFRRVDEPKE
jgi:hypothetical protein